jgi:hypothetical protein
VVKEVIEGGIKRGVMGKSLVIPRQEEVVISKFCDMDCEV